MVIVGAGAAGLFAALALVNQNKKVSIYEKMDRPGIKLSLAGGGRCNLSNTGDILAGLHGENFLRPALKAMDIGTLRNVLAAIGVETAVDEQGRLYPRGVDGKGLVKTIINYLKQNRVALHFNSPLTGLRVEDGRLAALEINNKALPCQAAILACGGNTWPNTGSDGKVWKLLGNLHTIKKPLPALAPIRTRETWPAKLKGLSVPDAVVTITTGNKELTLARGGLLFTHFGLSGPAVLDVSFAAARALADGKGCSIIIDLLPDTSLRELGEKLQAQRERTAANALATLLPAQLAKEIFPDQYIKSLAPPTLAKLAKGVKELRLQVTDVLGKKHAMVSQGGISLREVDPKSMESKKIRGLFIAGEMLAYHGKSGGYNLHGAFATGWLAGSQPKGDGSFSTKRGRFLFG